MKDKEPSFYIRENSTDYYTYKKIFLDQEYNFEVDSQPKYIIDCGAYIGLSCVYFKKRFPDATIICIEPDSENFSLLKQNCESYSNIIYYNSAIWNKKEDLFISDLGKGAWGYIVDEKKIAEKYEEISGVTITEIMKTNNIDTIDILKIDIEGSEFELFQENYDYWLSRTKLIVIELHDKIRKGSSKNFFKALEKYEYQLSVKGENIIIKMK